MIEALLDEYHWDKIETFVDRQLKQDPNLYGVSFLKYQWERYQSVEEAIRCIGGEINPSFLYHKEMTREEAIQFLNDRLPNINQYFTYDFDHLIQFVDLKLEENLRLEFTNARDFDQKVLLNNKMCELVYKKPFGKKSALKRIRYFFSDQYKVLTNLTRFVILK